MFGCCCLPGLGDATKSQISFLVASWSIPGFWWIRNLPEQKGNAAWMKNLDCGRRGEDRQQGKKPTKLEINLKGDAGNVYVFCSGGLWDG